MIRLVCFFLLILHIAFPRPLLAEETTPSHALHTLTEVINDLQEIRKIKGIDNPIEAVIRDPNKTPTDVYENIYALAKKLRTLSKRPEYRLAKPMQLPKKLRGRKVPEDVVALVQQIRKVTKAFRHAAGVRHESQEAPLLYGKTPPDIYQKASKALALADTLL